MPGAGVGSPRSVRDCGLSRLGPATPLEGWPLCAAQRHCSPQVRIVLARWHYTGVVGDLPPPFDPLTADRSDAARGRYVDALSAEWKRLVADPAFLVEGNIQVFLERHPSLVPGASGPT